MTTAVQTQSEYRDLPLVSLTESATNPRRSFDQTALGELAESIKMQGILAPLVVRPVGQHFEIVAGARRYRAAQLAGLETAPVRIVELTDAQALETSIVENLQRRDVHPLDEANGFAALMRLEEPKYSIEQIAAKVGKAPAFILARLKLVELVPAVVEAFSQDEIGLGHALLLAKLQPVEQGKPSPLAIRSSTPTAARPSECCSRFGICNSGLNTTFSWSLLPRRSRKKTPRLCPSWSVPRLPQAHRPQCSIV